MEFTFNRASDPDNSSTIEISTLEQLLDLIKEEGFDIIINADNFDTTAKVAPDEPDYSIQVYDNYVE